MSNSVSAVVTGVLLTLLLACQGDLLPRDASVGTGESPSQDGPENWTVAFDLQIGSVGGEDDAFTRVTQVLPAADGSVIVLDQDLKELTRYLPTGDLARRFGGPGPGPGEFIVPTTLGWWSGRDSVWVTDGVLSRLTIFTVEGEFGRTIPITGGEFAPGSRNMGWSYPLEGGVLARVVQERNGSDWGPVRVLRPGAPGDRPTEIARADRAESLIPIKWEQPGMMRHPIPDGPLLAFSPDGSMVFVVDREAASSVGEASVRIRTTSIDGTSLWEASLPYIPTAISRADRDSIQETTRKMFHDMSSFGQLSGGDIDAIFERTIGLPSHFPPVRSVVAADDGNLWIVWTDVGEGSEATVLGPDGSIIARVTLPDRVATGLAAVAGEYAWSIESTLYDVPIVRRHRIVRR